MLSSAYRVARARFIAVSRLSSWRCICLSLASHSVVQANGKTIPLPQPREHQIIFHLSHGSTISESIRLPDGKRIEWKSKVGPEGATVSEDLGQ